MTLRRVTDTVDVYVKVPTDGHGMPTQPHHTQGAVSADNLLGLDASLPDLSSLRRSMVPDGHGNVSGAEGERSRASVGAPPSPSFARTDWSAPPISPRVGSRRARVTNERISKRRC